MAINIYTDFKAMRLCRQHTSACELLPLSASRTTWPLNSGVKVLRFRFAIGACFQVVDIIPQSGFTEWPEFRGAVQLIIEAHNISKLCEKYPGKYTAPSDFYFGEIDCVFSHSKDAEIDLTVLRVESEVAQEDFDKKQKERGQQKPITPQSPAYQSPLVRRGDEDDNW